MKTVRIFMVAYVMCGLAAGASLGSGDCSDYIDLSGQPLPITVNGTTVGATNDYGPFPSMPPTWIFEWASASCAGPDVTYKWTVPQDGRYTFSLLGNTWNTGLLLYRFTCPNEPTYPDDLLLGDDDARHIMQSELYAVPLSAGQEVLIVVDGYINNSGPFQLHISEYRPAQSQDELDAFIESTMETHHIPGLSAVATHGGHTVWSGSYGHANISEDVPAADSTLFLLASISKTFVGVALMQLWEQGLFNLDDDIDLYLPWPVRNPHYPNEPITFRMLMTHTSSIKDTSYILNNLMSIGEDSPIALEDFLYNYLTPGGSYYNSGNYSSTYGPGEEVSYSNIGAALSGYLVERIDPAGRSLEDYCQQSIWRPLGMDETSWFLANLDPTHIAVRYRWNGNGYSVMPDGGVPWYPAGQVRTSSVQLARHLLAFQGRGEVDGIRILDSATVDSMLTPRETEADLWGSYGFLTVNIPWGGRNLWGHDGSTQGCRTVMFFCPEEDAGAVVLTNGEGYYGAYLVMYELLDWGRTADAPDVALGPVRLELRENYPNPFSGATTIPFYLSAPGVARLGVYDVSGRRVASLADGVRDAGLHVVTWDASKAASGIYYMRLEAGGASAVRRLVRIR